MLVKHEKDVPKALVPGEALGVGGQGGGREACGEQGLVRGGMPRARRQGSSRYGTSPRRSCTRCAAERKERHERGVQKGIDVRIEKVSKSVAPDGAEHRGAYALHDVDGTPLRRHMPLKRARSCSTRYHSCASCQVYSKHSWETPKKSAGCPTRVSVRT